MKKKKIYFCFILDRKVTRGCLSDATIHSNQCLEYPKQCKTCQEIGCNDHKPSMISNGNDNNTSYTTQPSSLTGGSSKKALNALLIWSALFVIFIEFTKKMVESPLS